MPKDGAFFTVQSFMVNQLGLSGNDLMVYAIIYGFSQDGESVFKGSRQYLADWCNSTVRGIQNNLNHLMAMKLIEQVYHSSDNQQVHYKALIPNEQSTNEQSSSSGVNKVHQTSEQSSPNNIADNIVNNIEETISKDMVHSDELPTETPTVNISGKPRRKPLFDAEEEKQVRKKGSLFERCVEEAKNRYHDELLTVVLEYLSYRIKSKQHGFGFQAWVNLLNKLDALADFDQEKIRIVEQSLQMKWDTFAELKSWNRKSGCERFGETEDMRSGVPVGEIMDVVF